MEYLYWSVYNLNNTRLLLGDHSCCVVVVIIIPFYKTGGNVCTALFARRSVCPTSGVEFFFMKIISTISGYF